MENLQMVLRRVEAVCNGLRANMPDVLEKAYDDAVARGDTDAAAQIAECIEMNTLNATATDDAVCELAELVDTLAEAVAELAEIVEGGNA